MGKAENYVEDYLKRKAKEHGFLCFKCVTPGIKGIPDRMLIGKGHTVFIECKSAVGKLSASQKLRIKEMQAAGADVRVYPTREDVDAFFEETTHW